MEKGLGTSFWKQLVGSSGLKKNGAQFLEAARAKQFSGKNTGTWCWEAARGKLVLVWDIVWEAARGKLVFGKNCATEFWEAARGKLETKLTKFWDQVLEAARGKSLCPKKFSSLILESGSGEATFGKNIRDLVSGSG